MYCVRYLPFSPKGATPVRPKVFWPAFFLAAFLAGIPVASAQSGGGGSGGGGGAGGGGGGAAAGGGASGAASGAASRSGAAATAGATTAPTAGAPNSPNVTSGANALGSEDGASAGEAGLAQENNWDLPVDLQRIRQPAGAARSQPSGDTSATSQAQATAGSTNLNSVNAGTVATSGNPGTASASGATSIGGTGRADATHRAPSIAGAGRPEDFVIPKPPIGVSLVSIRDALGQGQTATPRANGD